LSRNWRQTMAHWLCGLENWLMLPAGLPTVSVFAALPNRAPFLARVRCEV
jgi:hypothetical protein